jgi:hypothetical protein
MLLLFFLVDNFQSNRPLRPYYHVPATFPAIQKAILRYFDLLRVTCIFQDVTLLLLFNFNCLCSGDRPRMSDLADPEYTELYLACVHEKPSKRPSFDTICRKLHVMFPKMYISLVLNINRQAISSRLQGFSD